MIELVMACLIINIIMLVLLFGLITALYIVFVKQERKHKEEIERLRKEKDYHIKQLERRSGIDSENKGHNFGERRNKT